MKHLHRLFILIPLAACAASPGEPAPPAGRDAGPHVVAAPDARPPDDGAAAADDAGSAADAAPSADAGPAARRDAGPPPAVVPFDVEIFVASPRALADEVISLGVPFPTGDLHDDGLLALFDGADEVALHTRVLARWPLDGSIRSVLVAWRATMPATAGRSLRLRHGQPRGRTASALAPNPDGPARATLRDLDLARAGEVLNRRANVRFAAYDVELARGLREMSPPYDSYGVSCGSTTAHRTYYDGPHALYRLYLRTGDADDLRRARAESVWYRANELRFHDGRQLAVQVCQGAGWTPSVPLDWGVLRRMTGQGMLDDYLLTGDDAAREAVMAMGEAMRRNLPALRGGRENVLRVTERNLAWTMMAVASAYAIEPSPELLEALESLVGEAADWQAPSGAFEHDLVRPDPDECNDGPRGGSPFMTALLVDGLMDAYALTADPRVPPLVLGAARWLRDAALTSDGRALRYLWGCLSDDYDRSDTADLNLLIVPVLGAAAVLDGDARWLELGDQLADAGIEAMYVGRPKPWNQAARAFGRYLDHRARFRLP